MIRTRHRADVTRTRGQRIGDAAESLVAARLAAQVWTILGRQVRVGRAEIDLLALDPGPPVRLVAVEVRWRSSRSWGLPEETVDRRKIIRIRDALSTLIVRGVLGGGVALPRATPAVDLVALEPGRGDDGGPGWRHHHDIA